MAFQSFNNDLEQSFLLASTLSRAGISALNDLKAHLDSVTQQVAGIDAETLSTMTEEERIKSCMGASEEDNAKLDQFRKEAEGYMRLGRETAPNVLFIFLMTKFEAYIEDIIVTVCRARPSLNFLPEGATEDEVRNRVGTLIANQRIDAVGEDVLERMLNIPFSTICTAVQTSPREIDKAKAIRNIHIHNRGFVNRRNRDRIGGVEENVYFPITMEYLNDIKNKIFLSCLGIDKLVTTSYPEVLHLDAI